MDWWQTIGLMATLVLTGTAVATFGWRVLRRETDKLRRESREAHERISGALVQVRDDLRSEIGQVRGEIGQVRDDLRGEIGLFRDDLSGDIGQVRDEIVHLREGQASLREGLGEVRGELRGLTHSMQALREDFRAHVLAGAD